MISIVKVGGKVVENHEALASFLDCFVKIEGKKVLVHGGGTTATEVASRLGVETRMVEGRRVTSPEMLRVAMMVYAGLVNKNIVAALQARGVDSLGLAGADLDMIRGHRREGGKVDYGMVGDVDRVNACRLLSFLQDGITPVFAPLIHDGNGNMLNTNADTIASATARGVAESADEKVRLVYCFEKAGVLSDPDDDSSVIREITPSVAERLIAEGVIAGGMIPKVNNALDAIRAGVAEVVITNAAAVACPEKGTVIKGE